MHASKTFASIHFCAKSRATSWCCRSSRHNARIGPSWLIALLVEEDNNSKLEWPRERWVAWIRCALWRGVKTCSPKWHRAFFEMNAWKLARQRDRERVRVLKASAPAAMMTRSRRHLFFAPCLRGVGRKNSIANEWALASGRRKKVATQSGSHQINKCCGDVFALLVNAFGAGVANLVLFFFRGQSCCGRFFAAAGYARIGWVFRKFAPIKQGSVPHGLN